MFAPAHAQLLAACLQTHTALESDHWHESSSLSVLSDMDVLCTETCGRPCLGGTSARKGLRTTGGMTGVGVARVLAAEMTSETSGVIAALVATGAAGKTALLTDAACRYMQLPLLGLYAWTCLALHGHWVRPTAPKLCCIVCVLRWQVYSSLEFAVRQQQLASAVFNAMCSTQQPVQHSSVLTELAASSSAVHLAHS